MQKYYISIFSYNIVFLKQFCDILKNYFKNIKVNFFFLPLKKKKFTILKSPHIYKKAREQFEIRTYCLLIIISNCNNSKLVNFFKFINVNKYKFSFLPVSLKIKEYTVI